MACQGAVASSSVVVLEPGGKGGGALGVGGVDASVGPLAGKGAVQALHLPVLPRAVRLDEYLFNAEVGADLAKGPAVGPGVVGHDPLDPGDAVGGEVGRGALEEGRAGDALLVG